MDETLLPENSKKITEQWQKIFSIPPLHALRLVQSENLLDDAMDRDTLNELLECISKCKTLSELETTLKGYRLGTEKSLEGACQKLLSLPYAIKSEKEQEAELLSKEKLPPYIRDHILVPIREQEGLDWTKWWRKWRWF